MTADLAKSATGRQNSAAADRDASALLAASSALVAAAWRPPRPGVPVRSAELYDRLTGSLILTGRASAAAGALLSAASRQVPGGELPLRTLEEAAWRIDELPLLAELRLLGRTWRPLPGMPGRRDLRALGPVGRKRLNHANALLTAFAARDASAATKAIAAIGRDDRSKFSVLAYALYREAGALGLAIAIPRKYAF